MNDIMEQNKEMTAQQSLQLITETMNNSRKSILRNSAKYFILWGALLTAFSLIIFLLWHNTGNPVWNLFWFAMPLVGYPLAAVLGKKDVDVPQSPIGKAIGGVWSVFGAFSVVISAIAVFAVPMNITLIIVLLFGLAESVSGVLLRNWPIIIAGFILGVGGVVVASLLHSDFQLLLFTLAGVLLAVTGAIVQRQYR